MMNPTISVIVPIYNGKRYLRKCIQSIVRQSFRNIEIILVNDGSTDNSLEICENYAHVDNRIVIINKSNEGTAFARRDGILIARGNYVSFVDADDYLEPSALEKLINVTSKYRVDIVVGNFDRVLDNWGLMRQKMGNYLIANRLVGQEELRKIFLGNSGRLETFLWGRLYRLECIKKAMAAHKELLFPGAVRCEDRYMNLALAPFLNSMWVINDILYHYRFGGMTSKYLPIVKGEFYYNAKYDMCREYGLDDCLPNVFFSYMGELYLELRQQMHFKVDSEEDKRAFIKDQFSSSKILAWAKENLLEEYRKDADADALLRHDVDKILNITRQKEKELWKHYLLTQIMMLYQKIITR